MKYDSGNEIRKRLKKEEEAGEKRKREILKPYIPRSEEQERLDMLKMDLLMEKYMWMCTKHFLEQDNYYAAERVMAIKDYFKFLDKKRSPDRLNPCGELNGIMFIGVNPSERSMLVNVWDDPFGKYFGKMLEEAGIDKTKVWMTNLYKKQTIANRPLNKEEIKEAIEELIVEINYVNPKIIVALGAQPREVIGEHFSHLNWIGMWHPAYVIRNNSPDIRSKYLLELTKLKKYNE